MSALTKFREVTNTQLNANSCFLILYDLYDLMFLWSNVYVCFLTPRSRVFVAPSQTANFSKKKRLSFIRLSLQVILKIFYRHRILPSQQTVNSILFVWQRLIQDEIKNQLKIRKLLCWWQLGLHHCVALKQK